MNIKLYCVGHLKETYWKAACEEYLKRISKYSKIEIVEFNDEPTKDNSTFAENEKTKEIECSRMLLKIKPNDFVCALDLNQTEYTSEDFSKELIKMLEKGKSNLIFMIGGSLGLSNEAKQRANCSISFSKMTFPHQLCRVILLEQIYRGFRIYKNEPYHK